MVAQKGTNLIDGLDKLSKNKELREKWSCIVPVSDTPSSVVLLQRIVTFFLKSQQQILREKMRLKPDKKSMAFRQQLKKKNQPPKQLNTNETDELRSDQFLHNLFVFPDFKQEEILSLLNAKDPQLRGKTIIPWQEKKKQIETLIENNGLIFISAVSKLKI